MHWFQSLALIVAGGLVSGWAFNVHSQLKRTNDLLQQIATQLGRRD